MTPKCMDVDCSNAGCVYHGGCLSAACKVLAMTLPTHLQLTSSSSIAISAAASIEIHAPANVPSMKSLHCIKHNGIPSAKRRRQLGTDVLSANH